MVRVRGKRGSETKSWRWSWRGSEVCGRIAHWWSVKEVRISKKREKEVPLVFGIDGGSRSETRAERSGGNWR